MAELHAGQAIDRVLGKVDDLTAVVESVPCDVLDKANAAEWRRAKAGFDARHDVVGNAIRDLIDTSFRCELCSKAPQSISCFT